MESSIALAQRGGSKVHLPRGSVLIGGHSAQVAAVEGGGDAPRASLYARTEPAAYLSN